MPAKPTDLPEAAVDYELVPLERLVPHPRNPRRHDVDRIVASIAEHGFVGVIVAQTGTGTVIAGHGRLKAARQLGRATVPVEWLDVTDDEALRLMLNENTPGDHAGYEDVSLASVLAELAGSEAGLAGTGWELDAPAPPAPPAVVVPLAPLKHGHYLVSYPLERHGEIASIMDLLPVDDQVEVRHAANG